MLDKSKIFVSNIKRKSLYLDQNIKNKVIHLIPLSLVSSILEILSISMLVPILAYFVNLDNFTNSSFIQIQKILNFFFTNISLANLLIAILVLFLLKNILLLLIVYYRHNVNNLIIKSISKTLYTNYINSNFSNIYFLKTPTIIKNLTSEILLYGRYIFSFIILVTETILLISLIGFLFYIDYGITITIIILLLVFTLIYYLISKKFVSRWSKNREYYENLRLKNIQEAFSGFMTVKIFQLEKTFLKDFISKNDFYDNIKKERFIGETPRFILEIVLIFIIFTIISISSNFIGNEKKELFVLISLFSVFFIRMIPSMNKILIAMTSMKYCLNSVDIINNEIKKLKNFETIIENKEVYPINFEKNIKFININFGFNDEKLLLDNINFEIKKNCIFGISGPSGSGKSTLINILAGFLQPKSGQILLDDKSVDTRKKNWMELFSYVPQNIYIFEDTIRNNILLNNVNKKISDDKILNLIKKLKLNEIIKSNQDLDKYLKENGKNLSGGEKQRIGFARALIDDKPIMILDEATNALDKNSQKDILNLLISTKIDKTIIIISHDENVMKICEDIIYLS